MASPSEYTKLEVEDPSYSYPIKPKDELKQKKRSRRGLLKCCCCGFAILLAVLTLILGVAATCAYVWTKKQVVRLTVEEPLPEFPIVEMSLAELEVVKDRAVLFVDTIRAGKEVPDDLILSQHEFNGFIGHSDYLRGNAYVDIHDDAFSIQMSLPTAGLPGGKGRYFVASGSVKQVSPHSILALLDTLHPIHDLTDPLVMADLDISRDENSSNKWSAILNSGEVMGWNAPEDFMNQRKNLLEDLYDDPDSHDALEILNAISSITMEEGHIVIQANKKDYYSAMDDAVLPPKPPSMGIPGARSLLRKLL